MSKVFLFETVSKVSFKVSRNFDREQVRIAVRVWTNVDVLLSYVQSFCVPFNRLQEAK